MSTDGGEALYAFTLPFSAEQIKPTNCGFAVMGHTDFEYPNYYAMTKEQRSNVAKHYEEEKDYEVLEELPFWHNGGGMTGKSRTALFTTDKNGENIKKITEADFDTESMIVIGNDVFYTGVSYNSKRPIKNGVIYKLDTETGEIKIILNRPEFSIANMIEVNGQIWLSASKCDRYGINENNWVYTLNPENGELTLLRKEEYNMYGSVGSDCRHGGGANWQAKGDSLYFIGTREGNAVLLNLIPDGCVNPIIDRDGSVDCIALSDNSDEALVVGLFNNHLQELYSQNLKTGQFHQITHFNDKALEGKYVADYQNIKIESQGCQIEGWVLLPKDYNPSKTYPAVLDIHGGPKTVYGPVLYHEMQLWAGMGYFVFFCNPKGADGRDNKFMDIRGHYGEIDYQNIMDFTDAVLEKYPQIDKSKVCVTGGSYGGFMTNWIIGHTDRFCCAASQRSISNWLSFYGVSDIGFYFASDQCDANFYKNPEKLWQHSPIKYAENVKTPTLFIHSDEDYRCPLEQGLQMYTVLKDRGIPARLCMFHGENHDLSRSGKPNHRIRRLTEITNWFEKYSK